MPFLTTYLFILSYIIFRAMQNESSQGIIRQLSQICQAFISKVIRQLSESCQTAITKVIRRLSGKCQAFVKQSSGCHQVVVFVGTCQEVVRKFSRSHQTVCQKVVRPPSQKLSGSCQEVVRQLLLSRQAFITKSSGSFQKNTRHLSSNHLVVIKQLSF